MLRKTLLTLSASAMLGTAFGPPLTGVRFATQREQACIPVE
jgi:H+/Cl- antiporter ClcA